MWKGNGRSNMLLLTGILTCAFFKMIIKRSDKSVMLYSNSIYFRYNYGKTYNIVLGANQVVPGMEEGLMEMCVGEKRHLIIPPHLGYGERGVSKSHADTHTYSRSQICSDDGKYMWVVVSDACS